MAAGERGRRGAAIGLIKLLGLLVLILLGGRPARAGPPSSDDSTHATGATGATEATGATGSIQSTRATASATGPSATGPSTPELSTTELDPERLRLIWRSASVAWPLSPVVGGDPSDERQAPWSARLEQRERMLAGQQPAPSVRGVVEIDRQRAAGVWIAALETVRVRQFGARVPLRFVRGVDGHAAVIEPGRELAPGPGGERRFELTQPPGVGAVWSIEADEPTRILIERVEPRSPRYVALELEAELLEWSCQPSRRCASLRFSRSGRGEAEGEGELPTLLEPSKDGFDQLRLDAALAGELLRIGGDDRSLAKAIEAWRMLGAMAVVDRERPAVRPYFAPDRARPLPLAGTRATRLSVPDSRDYRLAEGPQRWIVPRKGPGQLRIAARTWAPKGEALRGAELRIYAGGRLLERIPLSPRRARRAIDPDTALPHFERLATAAGEPIGELVERTLVLAPGDHDYELELVGGPALLAITGARRIEATAASLRGWTPRKRARAAARALARSGSPARVWLELLLAERTYDHHALSSDDPRLRDLGDRSPLLACAILLILAGDPQLDAYAFTQLLERTLPWLAVLDRDRSLDPAVRGQLRARWLELAALHEAPRLAAALLRRDPQTGKGGNDPIAELPVAGLRTLAELLAPTRGVARSPALALLELARRRAPADEELRGQLLQTWTEGSRWSRRRPLPRGAETLADLDEGFTPAGEWLVPRETAPSDAEELASSWVRLEPGAPVRVRAELGDERAGELTRRMRLLDIHVATPPGSRDPVRLRVDAQRWWSPQLLDVQRHRLAVAPGVHELEIEGPPGTVAWVGAPPVEPALAGFGVPERLARRERMWPLARSVWTLPGPAAPGFVRLELRWPEELPARPVRIRVIEEDDAAERIVLFDPRTPRTATATIELDPEALPIEGSARASRRHDLVLPIAAATTRLRFEVEDELPIAASLSLRRGPQTRDSRPTQAGLEAADEGPALRLDDLAGLDHPALLAELAALSRRLLDDPEDLEARARRAGLLLLLGETGHARADLLRLAAFAEREDRSLTGRARATELLAELEQRFEALTDSREILVADPERVRTPTLIEPAIAAFVGDDRAPLEPWLEPWAELRELELGIELDGALARVEAHASALRAEHVDETQALLGALTHAHLLGRDPARAREAAREWLILYGRMPGALARAREPIAVGLASVPLLLAHLDDPRSDARDAGLAYGLARELEPVYGHTSVRRLAFVAGLRSDWSRLDHSQDSAGFERLELPVAEQRPSPAAEIREALLAAPWPASEAEQLAPARKGVLAWDARPGAAIVQLWCRATRPDLAPDRAADRPEGLGAARLQLRLRGPGRHPSTIERTLELPDAELGAVELPIERAGRHQLEVSLADDPIWRCSWRSSTRVDDEVALVEPRRRALWWTAEPQRAVELVVLGPATLELELRGVAGTEVGAVLASVERLGTSTASDLASDPALEPARGQLPLSDEVEHAVITETRRRFEVGHTASHTLLLTEPGPQRIRLVSDQGRVLIRARLRRDRGDIPPPDRVSLTELRPSEPRAPELLDWRALGPGPPILARDPVAPIRNRIGTLELQTTVGVDQIGDVDDLRPRPGMVASLGWRRALVDDLLWLSLAAETRLRDQTSPAGGGSLRIAARLPPLGVRTGAQLDLLAQSFADRSESSVRLYAFADRPTWLGPYLQLRPGLTVGLRWQSLDPQRVAAASTELEPHPRIYQRYIHDHPILLQPELELRLYPFQDMAVWTEAQLIPNSDMHGVDHLNFEVGTTGIARRPRPWVPSWGLSYQASPRFADADRQTAFVRHRISSGLGLGVWARDHARVTFGVSHQLFWSSVAPVRNVFELWLRLDASFGRRLRDHGPRELWFREPWAPRAWGDEQTQARSTYAPRER
ncbi:MAG: hypothetical protein R6X02_30785 [Enhygromyxa sp.]